MATTILHLRADLLCPYSVSFLVPILFSRRFETPLRSFFTCLLSSTVHFASSRLILSYALIRAPFFARSFVIQKHLLDRER